MIAYTSKKTSFVITALLCDLYTHGSGACTRLRSKSSVRFPLPPLITVRRIIAQLDAKGDVAPVSTSMVQNRYWDNKTRIQSLSYLHIYD